MDTNNQKHIARHLNTNNQKPKGDYPTIDIDVEQAEKLLHNMEVGTFLIRPSSDKSVHLSISVRTRYHTLAMRIFKSNSQFYLAPMDPKLRDKTKTFNKFFNKLDDLINYYSTTSFLYFDDYQNHFN